MNFLRKILLSEEGSPPQPRLNRHNDIQAITTKICRSLCLKELRTLEGGPSRIIGGDNGQAGSVFKRHWVKNRSVKTGPLIN